VTIEQFPNDPQLEALAARLSSLAPKLADDEQRELLYQCAFAAGETFAGRRAVRWRNISSVLAVLLCGFFVSALGRGIWQVGPAQMEHDSPVTQSSVPVTPSAVETPPIATADVSLELVQQRDSIQLDAWANHDDPVEAFSAALARFQQLDPAARSRSVTEIQRSL
jgi:hypothetical protein